MNFTRKPSLAVATIAALVGIAVAPAMAQQGSASAPMKAASGTKVEAVRMTATGEVMAVDQAKRTITIKGPKGNIGEYAVDPAVKNFDQVKVGDRLEIDYTVGLALTLVKGGDGVREKVEGDVSSQSPPGAKPAGTATRTTTIVANVEKVDKKRKIATLKGPEGKVVEVEVRDPKVLEEVKAGDQVVAKVTESVAVRVRAPHGPTKAASK